MITASSAWSVPVVAMLVAPAAPVAAFKPGAAPAGEELRELRDKMASTGLARVTLADGARWLAHHPELEGGGLAFSRLDGGPGRAALVTDIQTPAAPASPIAWERIARLESGQRSTDRGMVVGAFVGTLGALMGWGLSNLAEMEGGDVNNVAWTVVCGLVPFTASTLVGASMHRYTTVYDAELRPLPSPAEDVVARPEIGRRLEGMPYAVVTTSDGEYRLSGFRVEDDGVHFAEAKYDRPRPAVVHDAPRTPPLQSPVAWERIRSIERPQSQVRRGLSVGLAIGAIAMLPAGLAMFAGDPDTKTVALTTGLVLGVPALTGVLIGANNPRYEVVYEAPEE